MIDDSIDQHLKSSPCFAHEVLVFGGRLDKPAEHHSVVRWVSNGELHIRLSHGFEAGTPMPIVFPGIGHGLTEHPEPFAGGRCEKGLLIGKMPVKRTPGDAESLADGPQREMARAMRLDGAKGLVEERTAQIAVVVSFDGLLFRSGGRGTNHALPS